jgi:predicted nucleotidyltransferase
MNIEYDYTQKPSLGDYSIEKYFTEENSPFDIPRHTIYSCLSGSTAYGTNTPTSDIDMKGIVVPPDNYVLGLREFEQAENKVNDAVFYSLRKFFTLAYKNGPHAIEMLFTDDRHKKIVTPLMTTILQHRHKFLSNQLQYSLGGYAFAQLKQMRTKTKNLTGRVALIEKYGYDVKMASHAIRLYRMGREAMLTGDLQVLRPDATELLEIRNGKYTYDEFAVFEERPPDTEQSLGKHLVLIGGFAYEESVKYKEAMSRSILPEHPPFEFIEQLCVTTHREAYKL